MTALSIPPSSSLFDAIGILVFVSNLTCSPSFFGFSAELAVFLTLYLGSFSTAWGESLIWAKSFEKFLSFLLLFIVSFILSFTLNSELLTLELGCWFSLFFCKNFGGSLFLWSWLGFEIRAPSLNGFLWTDDLNPKISLPYFFYSSGGLFSILLKQRLFKCIGFTLSSTFLRSTSGCLLNSYSGLSPLGF